MDQLLRVLDIAKRRCSLGSQAILRLQTYQLFGRRLQPWLTVNASARIDFKGRSYDFFELTKMIYQPQICPTHMSSQLRPSGETGWQRLP